MFEEFKPFPLQEYESRYTISNRGRIYSNRKKDYLKTEISNGHNVVFLNKPCSNNRYTFRVDMLVAKAFLESSGDFLIHKDGNELNDTMINLEWIDLIVFLAKKYGSKWRQIQDMPYYISSNGKVWSLASRSLIKQQLTAGYMSVNIGYPKQFFQHVHRLVCSAFCSNPERKPVVNHKDGNKMNNTEDNLEWTTSSENRIHAVKLHNQLGKNAKKPVFEMCNDFCVELDWLPDYYILDDGRIYSNKSHIFLSQTLNNSGYNRICAGTKHYYVHKLVAEAYLSHTKKPEHTQVMHKNMIKTDNSYKNLKWCTSQESNRHSKEQQCFQSQKSVAKLDIKTGEIIETYSGIKIASRQTGTNSGSIVKVCKGIKPTAGGYKWKYTTS